MAVDGVSRGNASAGHFKNCRTTNLMASSERARCETSAGGPESATFVRIHRENGKEVPKRLEKRDRPSVGQATFLRFISQDDFYLILYWWYTSRVLVSKKDLT